MDIGRIAIIGIIVSFGFFFYSCGVGEITRALLAVGAMLVFVVIEQVWGE